MRKYFVIAGYYHQAQHWINNNHSKLSTQDYYPIIITDVIQLIGISDPNGIFIGDWKERVDIIDILQQLIISTQDLNKRQAFVNLVKKLPSRKNYASL